MFRITQLLSAIVAVAIAINLSNALPNPAPSVDLDARQAHRSERSAGSEPHALTKRASVCNGDASLCSRLYSNVTYIGAHDSYAIGTLQGAVTGHNQEQSVTQQLNDGIRLLQIQAHKSSNSSSSGSGIELCHSSCSIEDGGSLESYLSIVKTWINNNPNDVVTLLIVNSDDQPATTFANAFQSTGLASSAYSPGTSALAKNAWPTLGSLIDSKKTLVVFMDNSADVADVPYILPHFQNTWENPYDQTATPFNCTVDRINSGSSPTNLMYLVNHYLDSSFDLFGTNVLVPNIAQISSTNSYSSIMTDVNNCASMHGSSYPSYVLTDFYDQGNGSVFQAAAAMNGVQYVAKPIGNSTRSSSSSGSSSSGSGSSSGSPSSKLAASGTILAMAGLALASLLF